MMMMSGMPRIKERDLYAYTFPACRSDRVRYIRVAPIDLFDALCHMVSQIYGRKAMP
jgi:hypothetical protein